MSEQDEISITHLYTIVSLESENNTIQQIDSDIYRSISKLIVNLKSKEYDNIKTKIKDAMIDMIHDLVSSLLKLRLEKALLENSEQSMLLDEEKLILNSQKEMEEKKEEFLSGILNGKSELLGSNDQ
jgi:DNA replication initiation complex subunit (GINS family)